MKNTWRKRRGDYSNVPVSFVFGNGGGPLELGA